MKTTTTTIFCYGDSNTYGYDPRSYLGSRYPKEICWTERLQEKINKQVINLGVCGREIPEFEYEMKQAAEMLAGHLSVSREAENHALPETTGSPLSRSWLWIMLGTNDVLKHESITAEVAAEHMRRFLNYLIKQDFIQSGQIKLRLIAPPRMQPGTWVSARALTESARLGGCMRAIVPADVAFTDAGQWELPMCFDGVHLTEEGHRIFAENISKLFTLPS